MTQNADVIAREDLCRFLSACFYEPSAALAEERVFDSMLAAATAIHPDLAGHACKLGEAFAAQDLQALLVDYTRLFLGPIQALALPYESAWREGGEASGADPTAAVLELYEQGGFDIGEDFGDLPDHVAVELEFLYLLLFKQRKALESGNMGDLASARAQLQQFLGEHLGAWIGAFTDAVKEHAETSFYRELAALTERFVRLESDHHRTTAKRNVMA